MAAQILREFENDVEGLELITGTGGVFDVRVGGELVFEKSMLGRYPDVEDVMPLIRQRLS